MFIRYKIMTAVKTEQSVLISYPRFCRIINIRCDLKRRILPSVACHSIRSVQRINTPLPGRAPFGTVGMSGTYHKPCSVRSEPSIALRWALYLTSSSARANKELRPDTSSGPSANSFAIRSIVGSISLLI